MDDNKQPITRERLSPYYSEWQAIRPGIQEKYDRKDGSAVQDMEKAVRLYEDLLAICAEAGGHDRRSRLVPLNGEERLQFVKDKLVSPFALVQLDALFTELQKKTARYTAN